MSLWLRAPGTLGVVLLVACGGGGAVPLAQKAEPTAAPAPAEADKVVWEERSSGGFGEGGDLSGPGPGLMRGSGLGGSGTGMGGGGLGAKGIGGAPEAARGGFGAGEDLVLRPPRQASLRAGSTDDGADWAGFVSYLGHLPPMERDHYHPMEVASRAVIEVTGADGMPLPGARVELVLPNRRVSSVTYGDGRTHLLSGQGWPVGAEVQVSSGGVTQSAPWTGDGLSFSLPVVAPTEARVPIDVAIVIDTTGSMGDELAQIKTSLLSMLTRLDALERPADIRLAAVVYKDKGEEYLTRRRNFSGDRQDFANALSGLTAGGGGDNPEALNEALDDAVHKLSWRPDAARVAFVIADAPPHANRSNTVPYDRSAFDALAAGVRVHTVAASGLDEAGTAVFRQVAAVTRGRFVFIEYGGDVVGTAASHGIAGASQMTGNNLDQILYDRLVDEIEGWRRPR